MPREYGQRQSFATQEPKRSDEEYREAVRDLIYGLHKRHLKELELPFLTKAERKKLFSKISDKKAELAHLKAMNEDYSRFAQIDAEQENNLKKEIGNLEERFRSIQSQGPKVGLHNHELYKKQLNELADQIGQKRTEQAELARIRSKPDTQAIENAQKELKEMEDRFQNINPHINPHDIIAKFTPDQIQARDMIKGLIGKNEYGQKHANVEQNIQKIAEKPIVTPQMESFLDKQREFKPLETESYKAYRNSPETQSLIDEIRRHSNEHFHQDILPNLGLRMAQRGAPSSVDTLERQHAVTEHNKRVEREITKLMHSLHMEGLKAAEHERTTGNEVARNEVGLRGQDIQGELLKQQAALNAAGLGKNQQLQDISNLEAIGRQEQNLEQQALNEQNRQFENERMEPLKVAQSLSAHHNAQPQGPMSTSQIAVPQYTPAPPGLNTAAGALANLAGIQMPGQQQQQQQTFAAGGSVPTMPQNGQQPYSPEQQQMLQIMDQMRREQGMNSGQNPHAEALPYLGAALLSKGHDEYSTQALGRGYQNYHAAREAGEARKHANRGTMLQGLDLVHKSRFDQQKLAAEMGFKTQELGLKRLELGLQNARRSDNLSEKEKKAQALLDYRNKLLELKERELGGKGGGIGEGKGSATKLKHISELQEESQTIRDVEEDLEAIKDMLEKGKVKPGGFIPNYISEKPLTNSLLSFGTTGSQKDIDTYNRLLGRVKFALTPAEGKRLSAAYKDMKPINADLATDPESTKEYVDEIIQRGANRKEDIQKEFTALKEGQDIPTAIQNIEIENAREPKTSSKFNGNNLPQRLKEARLKIQNNEMSAQELAKFSDKDRTLLKKSLGVE